MTCCIVGLLIMMAVGRLRQAIGGARGDAEVLFAPVAHRPGPGEQRLAPAAAVPDHTGYHHKPASASLFQYAAVGIALSLVLAPVLVWIGVAVNTTGLQIWILRSGLYLTVLVAAVAFGRTVVVLRVPRGAASLLIVAGVIVFELGLADMHVFRLFDIDGLTGDMVFHNVGPALAMAGGLVLLYGAAGRSKTSRRSSRSTVTTARPSSSAVTTSSSPPVATPPLTM